MSADRDEGAAKVRMPVALPADLGAFLFADAGAGPGGTPLTALSALARLGMDPWDEAGRLAKLPDREAAAQLARSLAAAPGASLPDPAGCARRLVALLPGRAAPSRPSPARPADTDLRAVRRRAAVLAVAGALTGLALLLAGYAAAGDMTARSTAAGNTAARNTAAGNTAAGNTVAGNTAAGNMGAGRGGAAASRPPGATAGQP